MRFLTTVRAGRSSAPRRLGSAARLFGGVAHLIRRFARLLAERRQRRRAALHSWTTMDARLLADIGVRRSDVHAVLYAGVPIERLGARPVSGADGEVAEQPSRAAPHLRLVVADHLDEAA